MALRSGQPRNAPSTGVVEDHVAGHGAVVEQGELFAQRLRVARLQPAGECGEAAGEFAPGPAEGSPAA
ncbi:hypothetical protein [Streptomyces sp. NPDC059224]|uniref:hypothetical protein n=1 Tax=Streptomyces sp. NPDC059224 TaxID=3346775 RepID=UPI00368641AE